VAEDILEIERDPAWQRLQRQDAEELADSGIDLREAAAAGGNGEASGERRVVEFGRRSRPGELAANGCRRTLDRVRVTHAGEERTRVFCIERRVELGLLRSAYAAPRAICNEPPRIVRKRELLDAPFRFAWLCDELQLAEVPALRQETFGGDVEFRPAIDGALCVLCLACLFRAAPRRELARARHREAGKPRHDAPARRGGPWCRPRRRSGEIAPAQIELPIVARTAGDDLELVEAPPEHLERGDIEIDPGERDFILVAAAGRRAGAIAIAKREPGVHIQRRQVAAHPDAGSLGAQWLGARSGAPQSD